MRLNTKIGPKFYLNYAKNWNLTPSFPSSSAAAFTAVWAPPSNVGDYGDLGTKMVGMMSDCGGIWW